MTVEWTGRETRDPETLGKVFQAKVRDASVSVYVSDEALGDIKDFSRIQAVAESKIQNGMVDGKPPKKVAVTTADFRP